MQRCCIWLSCSGWGMNIKGFEVVVVRLRWWGDGCGCRHDVTLSFSCNSEVRWRSANLFMWVCICIGLYVDV